MILLHLNTIIFFFQKISSVARRESRHHEFFKPSGDARTDPSYHQLETNDG